MMLKYGDVDDKIDPIVTNMNNLSTKSIDTNLSVTNVTIEIIFADFQTKRSFFFQNFVEF